MVTSTVHTTETVQMFGWRWIYTNTDVYEIENSVFVHLSFPQFCMFEISHSPFSMFTRALA